MVTIVPWPAGVPSCVMPLSPNGGLRDNRLSFETDDRIGVIERPASTWAPEIYQVELTPLSREQFALFQDWYRGALAYGSLAFEMDHPVLRTPGAWRIVKADPPYQVRKLGLMPAGDDRRRISVSFSVMSVPGGAPDWWALYRGEDGRMPVFVADFAAGRFGYRIGTSVVTGFGALFDFSRNSTASYLDGDGLIKTAGNNVLRIEHGLNGNRIGALIERATQNYLDRSHDFGGYWTASPAGSVNILATAPVSPDGNATRGWRFVPSTDNNVHNAQTTWARNTSALVASVFARVGGYPFVTIGTNQAAGEAAVFNLANQTFRLGGSYTYAGGIIPYPNSWYRLWVSFVARSEVVTETLRIKSQPEDSGSFNLSFAGNGASGTNFWGAQVELRRTGADFNGGPSAYLQTDGSSRSKPMDNIAFKPALGPTDLLIAFGDGRADVQAAGVDIQPGYWPGTSLNYSGYGVVSRLVGYA